MRPSRIFLIIAIMFFCAITASAQKPLTKPEKPQAQSSTSSYRDINKAMPSSNKRYELYNILKESGTIGLGDWDSFNTKLDDPKKRDELYDILRQSGAKGLGSREDFNSKLIQTGNPKPVSQDQYTFSGKQLGIETPTSAPTIGGVNAEPNFDWNTGQWDFQKEQKGEPIAFGANAPYSDTSIADMAGKPDNGKVEVVGDTGVRNEYHRYTETEMDRRRKMQEAYEKEQGIRKEMMLQGLDPDDEEDRRTFEEEPERDGELVVGRATTKRRKVTFIVQPILIVFS